MFTSAPTISQRFATSFIKLILVASIALEAYFVISADNISINIIRKLFSRKGRYNLDIKSSAFLLSTPTITLSGLIKSFIAAPSFKNSGLEATSKSRSVSPRSSNRLRILSLTLKDVPTGTVLFVTTKSGTVILFAIVSTTSST